MVPLTPPIGIEQLGVDVGTLVLDIAALCEHRGWDTRNFVERLHCRERTVLSPHDDVVTLAVNAARAVVTPGVRASIRWLIVATESAVDQEKSVSTWVHRFLELPPDCRNFEIKHACYGATVALQVAARLIASDPDPETRVLVINADHALPGLHGVQEPVLGAAGVALLVSRFPQLVALDPGPSGVHAHETADIFRPAPGVETGDADESLTSYLDGAEATWRDYNTRRGGALDFERHFDAHVYHVPFGGLAERAHLRLAQQCLGLTRAEARAHWQRKGAASLCFNQRMGGIYGGSTFVALASVLEHMVLAPERRIGVYAYGSGSCAELYGVLTTPASRDTARALRLSEALDARQRVSVSTYEACEQQLARALAARDYAPDVSVVADHAPRHGRLCLTGISNYVRSYAWS